MNKKIATRTIEAFLDENDIVRINVLPNATIDIDDAVDNFLVVKQVSNNQPRLKLWDTRVNWKITKEARDYLLKEDGPERTIARAVIVKTMSNKIITNFILKLNSPKSPLKVFISEEKAVEWLSTFR